MNNLVRFYACIFILSVIARWELPTTAADWPTLGRDSTRNAVSPERRPPLDWSVGVYDRETHEWKGKSKNVLWNTRLGGTTFGTPIVAGGRVYIGTNLSEHVPQHRSIERQGYLLCFRESDGEFLWQFSANEIEGYAWRYWNPGVGSSPLVEGNRVWFVSNRWEVICLDTAGFHDDEDDGPVKGGPTLLFEVMGPNAIRSFRADANKDRLRESITGLKAGLLTDWLRKQFAACDFPLAADVTPKEGEGGKSWTVAAAVRGASRQFELRIEDDKLKAYKAVTVAAKEEADVVWRFDMRKELKVAPYSHIYFNPNRQCSPVSYRNRIYVVTGNGVEQRSSDIPAPDAPSLVCFDKETGKVLWTDASPGGDILRGQFADPLVFEFDGRAQVVVGQGDGWVRSFDALTGKLLWEFDINEKKSLWTQTWEGSRNSIMTSAVFRQGRVYVGSGRCSETGRGPGRLVCIDPTKTGDISSQLAVDADGRILPHRRFQAVVPEKGERAIPNPNSGLFWEFTTVDRNKDDEVGFTETFHRTQSSVAVKNDLVIACDSTGLVHCVHALTGKQLWAYDTLSHLTGSPLIVHDRVYVADQDGVVAIFRLSGDPKTAMKKVDDAYRPLAEMEMDNCVSGSPVFANGVLYIASWNNLWAITSPNSE